MEFIYIYISSSSGEVGKGHAKAYSGYTAISVEAFRRGDCREVVASRQRREHWWLPFPVFAMACLTSSFVHLTGRIPSRLSQNYRPTGLASDFKFTSSRRPSCSKRNTHERKKNFSSFSRSQKSPQIDECNNHYIMYRHFGHLEGLRP